MGLQLLEEVDFDNLYAEMLPNLAYVDKMHPLGAAYEAYLPGKYNLQETRLDRRS